MSENDDIGEFYKKVNSGQITDNTQPTVRGGRGSIPVDECSEEATTDIDQDGAFAEDAERRWAANDQNFWACSATYDYLPAGLYKPKQNNQIGYYVEKQIVDTDELLVLPDTASQEVLDEIEKFAVLKEEFDKRGFVHKRGILMWGDPGSGKTATIQLLIDSMTKKGCFSLFGGHPITTTACMQMIRRIEPDREMLVILEDFESMVREYGDSEYLAMLDGESQVGNVVFVATTNYPEKLDKRFIDRPSRFDTIKKIGMPTSEAREFYLKAKEPTLKGDELEKWVKLSKGFSIAHLKEMIISNRCYNVEIEKVVTRLNYMKKRKISSDDALPDRKSSIGFKNDTKDDSDFS